MPKQASYVTSLCPDSQPQQEPSLPWLDARPLRNMHECVVKNTAQVAAVAICALPLLDVHGIRLQILEGELLFWSIPLFAQCAMRNARSIENRYQFESADHVRIRMDMQSSRSLGIGNCALGVYMQVTLVCLLPSRLCWSCIS